MRIALGCDHRGLNLKQFIIDLISEMGHDYEDFGCYDTTPVDYPDIAQKVSQAVAERRFNYGILICSSGIGMSIAANKIKGIRAALCHNSFTALCARQHNDANVLCLGENIVEQELAEGIVRTFLNTEFEGGRHSRRLEKIKSLEVGATGSVEETQ
jgi:ribose 5-phosphate isomerase B